MCTEFPDTVNRGDKYGRTPLLLAAGAQIPSTTKLVGGKKNTLQSNEDVRPIETLLHHGANVRAQDYDGNTCLHQACAWGNLKTARVLVQAGADPLSQNKSGWKPDSYSLSVQADVYFRNLVAEFEKRKAEDETRRREARRGNGGGGQVRLVSEPEEEDNDGEFFDADDSRRSRAGSGRSDTLPEQPRDRKYDPVGLNINVGPRADTWR